MTERVQVYVGLGCNLGERKMTLSSAITALQSHPSFHEFVCSSLYESDPMGPQDQPDYLNAVAGFCTSMDAHELLAVLQSIEHEHGRVRDGSRWGARTLDLDLLLYGDAVIDSPTLSVPHPGIPVRSFVLLPLAELTPDLHVPEFGPVSELLSECRQFGIRRLDSTL